MRTDPRRVQRRLSRFAMVALRRAYRGGVALRRSRHRGPVALVAGIVAIVGAFALGASACGVTATSAPTKVGEAVPAAQGNTQPLARPGPENVRTPEELVDRYLQAAIGGGDPGVDQAKSFLTTRLQRIWQPAQKQPTIVRPLAITTGVTAGGKTPVTVRYQTVGVLTEQGYVQDLRDQVPSSSDEFVVVAVAEDQLRIDLAPPRLMISQDALTRYYRVQPIYFWDSTGSRLVPDLRYLPKTLTPDQRPNQLLEWLLDGPSPWLNPSVTRLPAGTDKKGPVVSRDGRLQVNLSAQADATDEQPLDHLFYQLQWSLRTDAKPPPLELQIEGQSKSIGGSDEAYIRYNAAAGLPPAQRFDIKDGRVVPEADVLSPPPMPVLASKANRNVAAAAVTADLGLAAFVQRESSGARSLHVARQDANAGTTDRWIMQRSTMGRPVWIPGPAQRQHYLLVPASGRLFAVRADGPVSDVTPPGLQVRSVAVAPDGRRVAFVGGERAYVAALTVDNNGVSLGSQLRPLGPGGLRASAVAWQTEDLLLVGGSAAGSGAMWRVSSDGVIAEDQSDHVSELRIDDVVAYPSGPNSPTSDEVIVLTNEGAAYFFPTSTLSAEPSLTAPFYAG